jgi:hypothetical protein
MKVYAILSLLEAVLADGRIDKADLAYLLDFMHGYLDGTKPVSELRSTNLDLTRS